MFFSLAFRESFLISIAGEIPTKNNAAGYYPVIDARGFTANRAIQTSST